MNDVAYSYPGARRRRKRRRSKKSSYALLATLLILCCFVAAVGARIAALQMHPWFAGLAKPRHNPPTWLFAPVWMGFFAVMAVAACLVWRSRSDRFRIDGLILFSIQLVLNLIWVILFFQLHRLLVAVVVLLGLWFAVAFTAALFWQTRRMAGALMLLCLAMISYAIGLNLVLLRLN